MAEDDDAVKGVKYQGQQPAKQLCKGSRSVPSGDSCMADVRPRNTIITNVTKFLGELIAGLT